MQDTVCKKYPVLKSLQEQYPAVTQITAFIDSSLSVRDVHHHFLGFSSKEELDQFLYRLQEGDKTAISLYHKTKDKLGL